MRGLLIALEGVDGSGKSTLASALASALTLRGHDVTLTKEPTSGARGSVVRSGWGDFSDSEADRRGHVHDIIAPALARGDIVITDRYFISCAVHDAWRETSSALEAVVLAAGEHPVPDLWVHMTTPVGVCMARVAARGEATTTLGRDAFRFELAFEALRLSHAGQTRVCQVTGTAMIKDVEDVIWSLYQIMPQWRPH